MNRFVRNFDAGAHLDTFLVSAVSAILLIRFYLHLTGYPQLGGDRLHIAHMLWGGLLMLAAMGILLSFLGRQATRVACLLGGIGFGAFIDEVGKFVTRDNDYFFEPSVAIMYATFVVFYLFGRLVQSHRDFTQAEYLANALVEMEELALHDLDEEEKERALAHLERSDPGNPLTAALTRALADASLVPRTPPGPFRRVRMKLHEIYRRVAHLPGFAALLTLFFVVQLLIKAGLLFAFLFLKGSRVQDLLDGSILAGIAGRARGLTFSEEAEILIGVVEAGFVLAGILSLPRSRLQAYRLFRASILVYLFVTEIFVFAREEWSALVGFVFNLLVLLALAFLIDREKATESRGRRAD